eukprot:Skav217770  [mRNA]  locus=scaffold5469:25448:25900:- [translate_table: standard]
MSFDRFGRSKLKKDAIYVVIGGARKHGLSALVAETLAEMGAGTVAVVGRSKADDEFLTFCSLGGKQFKTTRIVALQCDINRVGSIPEALQQAGLRGPVRGVLHGAACFDGDKLFRNVSG